jgi:2-polyprenyl-3-methyl-5-hydroxy-6-metoxy-1,4-benzoquinol methylase
MNILSYFWLKRRQDAVRKILKKTKVLDIGCGENKIIPEAIGLDLYNYPGVNKIGSAEKLPFPNKSFDAVTLLEVIEHLKNPEKTLKEIKRVLKPNGQVIISTPNVTWGWKIVWFLWSHTFGRKWLDSHFNKYNEKKLIELISEYFEIKSVRKVNRWILIVEGVKKQ